MQHSQTHLRTRPISAGHLRAFEAVARHLNFRAAAEEMALTQSAVSRQIQSLEEEVGVSLFLRHTRAVELTSAGAQLLLAVQQSLPRIDGAVRQIRQSAGRKSVSLTTFASFASMWLIPRLEAVPARQPRHRHPHRRHPTRRSTWTWPTSTSRCATARAANMPPDAVRLFGETADAGGQPLAAQEQPADQEAGRPRAVRADRGRRRAPHAPGMADLAALVRRATACRKLQPKRWLYFNYAYQMVQAALTGQGVVLARRRWSPKAWPTAT